MAYQIKIKASALSALKKLDAKTKARLWLAISSLAEEVRPRGSTKLKGAAVLWRIRVGDFRIIYQIRDEELVVLIIRIGHRREVYR
jgi:mRNA interferase RelE/StbE